MTQACLPKPNAVIKECRSAGSGGVKALDGGQAMDPLLADAGSDLLLVTNKNTAIPALPASKSKAEKIQDGLEKTISQEAKQRIDDILGEVNRLSDVEKLLLYLKLPTGTAIGNAKDGNMAASANRMEQIQAVTWIKSHLEEDTDTCLPKQQVYDQYRFYSEKHGLKPLSQADFGKVMRCVFPNVKSRRLGQRGQSRHCYGGLRERVHMQAPKLPDIQMPSPEPLVEESCSGSDEVLSASCSLVMEWAQKLLSRNFSSVQDIGEYLVTNNLVNTRSMSAFTVIATMQREGITKSQAAAAPPVSNSQSLHRETQLQLQRKLQERELLKEQKRKLEQQRCESRAEGSLTGEGDSRHSDDSSRETNENNGCSTSQGIKVVSGGSSGHSNHVKASKNDKSQGKPLTPHTPQRNERTQSKAGSGLTPQKLILPKAMSTQPSGSVGGQASVPVMSQGAATSAATPNVPNPSPQPILVFSPQPGQVMPQPLFILSPLHHGGPLSNVMPLSQPAGPSGGVSQAAPAVSQQGQPVMVTAIPGAHTHSSKPLNMVHVPHTVHHQAASNPSTPTTPSIDTKSSIHSQITPAPSLTVSASGTGLTSKTLAVSSSAQLMDEVVTVARRRHTSGASVSSDPGLPVTECWTEKSNNTNTLINSERTLSGSNAVNINPVTTDNNIHKTTSSVTHSSQQKFQSSRHSLALSMPQLTSALASAPGPVSNANSAILTPTSSVSNVLLSPTSGSKTPMTQSFKLVPTSCRSPSVHSTLTLESNAPFNKGAGAGPPRPKLSSKTVSSLLKEQRGYALTAEVSAPYVNDRRPVSQLLKECREKGVKTVPTAGTSLTGSQLASLSPAASLSPTTLMIQTVTMSRPTSTVGKPGTASACHPGLKAALSIPVSSTVTAKSMQKTFITTSCTNSTPVLTSVLTASLNKPATTPTNRNTAARLRKSFSVCESQVPVVTSGVHPMPASSSASSHIAHHEEGAATGTSVPKLSNSRARSSVKPASRVSGQKRAASASGVIGIPAENNTCNGRPDKPVNKYNGGKKPSQTQRKRSQSNANVEQIRAAEQARGMAPNSSLVLSMEKPGNVNSLERDALSDYIDNEPAPELADITPTITNQMVDTSQEVETLNNNRRQPNGCKVYEHSQVTTTRHVSLRTAAGGLRVSQAGEAPRLMHSHSQLLASLAADGAWQQRLLQQQKAEALNRSVQQAPIVVQQMSSDGRNSSLSMHSHEDSMGSHYEVEAINSGNLQCSQPGSQYSSRPVSAQSLASNPQPSPMPLVIAPLGSTPACLEQQIMQGQIDQDSQLMSPGSGRGHCSLSSTPMSMLSPQASVSSRSLGPSPVELNNSFMPIQNIGQEGLSGVNLVRPTATVANSSQFTGGSGVNPQMTLVQQIRGSGTFTPYASGEKSGQAVPLEALAHQKSPPSYDTALKQKLEQKLGFKPGPVVSQPGEFAPVSSIKPLKRGHKPSSKQSHPAKRARHHSANSRLGGGAPSQPLAPLLEGSFTSHQVPGSVQSQANPVQVSVSMANSGLGLGPSTPESPFSPEIQDIMSSGNCNVIGGSMFRSHSVPVPDMFGRSASATQELFFGSSDLLDQQKDALEDFDNLHTAELGSLLQDKLQNEATDSSRGLHTSAVDGFGARRNLRDLLADSKPSTSDFFTADQDMAFLGDEGTGLGFGDQKPLLQSARSGSITLASATLGKQPNLAYEQPAGRHSMAASPPCTQTPSLDFSQELQRLSNQPSAVNLDMARPHVSSGLNQLDTPSSLDTMSTQDSHESLGDPFFHNMYDGSNDISTDIGGPHLDLGPPASFSLQSWDMTQMVHD